MNKKTQKRLHRAVKSNNIKAVEKLLSNGVDVNALDHEYRSALYYAVEANNERLIQILVKNGANISNFNENDPSFLTIRRIHELAIVSKKGKIVQLVLKSGGDPNYMLYYALKLYSSTVNNYSQRIVTRRYKRLLEDIPSYHVNCPKKRYNIDVGTNYDILKLLVNHNAILERTSESEKFIKLILRTGSLRIAKLFFYGRTKLSKCIRNNFPVMSNYAVSNSDPCVLFYLLRYKPIHAIDVFKCLHTAITIKRFSAIKMSLEALTFWNDNIDSAYQSLIKLISTSTITDEKVWKELYKFLIAYSYLELESLSAYCLISHRVFTQKCCRELLRMKNTSVYPESVTIDRFLLFQRPTLRCWEVLKFVCKFKKLCTAKKFPIYHKNLKQNLDQAGYYRVVLKKSRRLLSRLLGWQNFSLDGILDKILKHLTNEDLYNLIQAFGLLE